MHLFRRFMPSRPDNHLHSSGITGSTDKMGATSAESFATRQKIASTRRLVGSYRDAGVLHNYRAVAQAARSNSSGDDAHHKKYTGSRITPHTSRIDNRATSRIEHPSTATSDVPPLHAPDARARFGESLPKRRDPYS